MSSKSILVTGDVVRDHHLYGGDSAIKGSFHESGTKTNETNGGACLTKELLGAIADSEGVKWDKVEEQWKEGNADRKKKGANPNERKPLPRPDKHPHKRPVAAFEVSLGLKFKDLADVRGVLHSYGVWTPHKKSKKDKELVWRVATNFGYGSTQSDVKSGSSLSRAASSKKPDLIMLDDGGMNFRHERSRPLWPDFSNKKATIILKMSHPVGRGDLWAELVKTCADRLMVVVSAEDLRIEDVLISRRLSWEQTVIDTMRAFEKEPVLKDLLKARDVIVNFGSAGVLWTRRAGDSETRKYRLVFDPNKMEKESSKALEGLAYGFQTCLVTAIASHLAKADEKNAENEVIINGIKSGLGARRELLLLGHGPVSIANPGFPFEDLGEKISSSPKNYVDVEIPADLANDSNCAGCWTILREQEGQNPPDAPMVGLGILTAIHGKGALMAAPNLEFGPLFSVDRKEIESLRTLKRLMEEYENIKVQNKPLSIAVFGPPGAGKSFAVKAIARNVLNDKVPLLEFNLSQFSDSRELFGAFHQIRDKALQGITPVVFWDEFDSSEYKWLQYLLAPMQDGAFQEGRDTHPIGKCIFVFAGATSSTLKGFGPRNPDVRECVAKSGQEDAQEHEIEGINSQWLDKQEEHWHQFKLRKGPDFISRLHGYLDVTGPNPRKGKEHCSHHCGPDQTYPIRRALMLRGILGIEDGDNLSMDRGLLFALLAAEEYRHGARSFEKILLALRRGNEGPITRSALPPDSILDRDVDAIKFRQLLEQRLDYKGQVDIEELAAACHKQYLVQSTVEKWPVDDAVDKPYQDLSSDSKASNRAAASRIPEHLELIGFVVEADIAPSPKSWKQDLERAIQSNIDRLAKAEHIAWMGERAANGWSYAPVRNNEAKQHNAMVDWPGLSEADKNKDRNSVRNIPAILAIAKYRAVPVNLLK